VRKNPCTTLALPILALPPVEKPIGGGTTVDVAAEKDGVRMAVEVETGNSDAVHNANRASQFCYSKIIVFAINHYASKLTRPLPGVHKPNNVIIFTSIRQLDYYLTFSDFASSKAALTQFTNSNTSGGTPEPPNTS
jgi:predicted RecB family endonuclease